MVRIERSALVMHPASRMSALVADIDAYPQFLPWCSGAEARVLANDTVEATLHVEFRGLRQRFTTRNRTLADGAIELALVDGPFRSLEGLWQFVPLRADASKVQLVLSYQLASGLLEHVAGPAFQYIAGTMVEAFTKRADALAKATGRAD